MCIAIMYIEILIHIIGLIFGHSKTMLREATRRDCDRLDEDGVIESQSSGCSRA